MLSIINHIGTVARLGGVPALLTPFVDSFVDLMQWNQDYLCKPDERIFYPRPPACSVIDIARNMICESFLGDWVLMLDSDHAFEPDLLGRIMNIVHRTGAEVVSGIYQYKMHPYSPVAYQLIENKIYPLIDWDRETNAIQVGSVGAGCLWIKRSVLNRIKSELGEKPFDRYSELSEDHSFCERLRKLDIPCIWAPKIECHHLQVRPLTLSDYDREWVNCVQPVETRCFEEK